MDDNEKNIPENEEELTGTPASPPDEIDEEQEEEENSAQDTAEEDAKDDEQAASDRAEGDAFSAYDKREDYSEEELTGELERLTVLFRDELKKASESAEGGGEVIQELDEIKERVEKEIIPEEELCRCCGERRRDTSFGENYEYCAHCREGMRHYPLGLQYWALVLAVVVLAGIATYYFFVNFNSLYAVRKAEKLVAQNKITSAIDQYTEASSLFTDNSLTADRVSLRVAELSADSAASVSNAQDLADSLDTIFTPLEYKLPWNRKYYDIRNAYLVEVATLSVYTALGEKYQDETVFPYETVAKALEDYIGKSLEIDEPEVSGGLSALLLGSGGKIETVYDAGILRLLQFSLLQAADGTKDYSSYLEKTKEETPERLWLYGYELGTCYAKNGEYDKANAFADTMLQDNAEDTYAYCLRVFIYRLQGDYDAGIAACDEGNKVCGDTAELYRQKAILLVLDGKADEAQKILEDIIDGTTGVEPSLKTYYTCALAAKEAGDKSALNTIDSTLSTYSVEYSDVMKAYFKGKKTAKQLFTSGTYDVS